MRKVSVLVLMIVSLLASSAFANGEKAEKKAHDYVGVKNVKVVTNLSSLPGAKRVMQQHMIYSLIKRKKTQNVPVVT